MSVDDKIINAINLLNSLLGKNRVISDQTSMLIYSRDIFMPGYLDLREGKIQNLPWAACFPENIEEVAKVVGRAQENRIPLIAFGAGSGVLGGTVPVTGGIMVDLKRMHQIRNINPTNLTVEVEAGVMGEDLERALNETGFTLGHFPSSIYCSTVGGWLSTRSAGQLSSKYGKIEDLVISLEGVLADGSVFHTRKTPRSATGPDLDQILVGSEGTLGIITSALLAISRLPEKKFSRGFRFEDVPSGMEAMRTLTQKELVPAALRLYDPVDTGFNRQKLSGPESGCLLIAVYQGANNEQAELKARLGFMRIKEMGGKDLGEEPGEKWYEHRYAVSYQQSKILSQPNTLLDTIEVSVIWKDALELYQKVIPGIGKVGLAMAHFSHAWREGVCVYFSILVSDPDPEILRQKHLQAWQAAMEPCLTIGASISHHHGIGRFRSEWLKKELGVGHELLQKLKSELDPAGIFNPEKLGFSAKNE